MAEPLEKDGLKPDADVAIGGITGFFRLATRFVAFALPYWDKLLLRVVLQIATAVVGVVGALAVGRVIDSLAAGDSASFVRWAGLSLVTASSGLILLLSWAAVSLYVRLRVDLELKRVIFNHTLRMSPAFLDSRPIGESMYRINNDSTAAADLATSALPELFERLFPIMMTLTILMVLNRLFVLLIVIYITMHFLFSHYVMGYGYRLQSRLRMRQQEVSAILQESLSAYAISKALSRERHEASRLFTRMAGFMRSWLGYYITESIWNHGTVVLQEILRQPVYILLCGALILAGKMTVGDYVAIQGLIWMVLAPLILIVYTVQRFRVACVPAQRMLQTLDIAPVIADRAGAVPLAQPVGKITFEHVWFRYNPEGPDVIKDLSFTVEAGRKLAIVGISGSGKTSIFNLLMRFADPAQGRVLIDGIDLRDLQRESYVDHVGLVLQDNFLFSASIRDNIKIGRIGATEEEIERAAAVAGLTSAVRMLPKGLDTVLLEGGNLSMGHKQLVAIARAILRDPRFLYMDEATSSIDPVTEAMILKKLAEIERGRTRVLITHHVGSVQDADAILVMEEGVCMQYGRHDDLMKVNGAYRRLWAAERNTHGPVPGPIRKDSLS